MVSTWGPYERCCCEHSGWGFCHVFVAHVGAVVDELIGRYVQPCLRGSSRGHGGPGTLWLASLADAASKHAVLGFFDCLRAEVEEYDVVVSTVSPTFVRSYNVSPGQGSWEASIWKCELSAGSQRNRAAGGLRGALGEPDFTGPGGIPKA